MRARVGVRRATGRKGAPVVGAFVAGKRLRRGDPLATVEGCDAGQVWEGEGRRGESVCGEKERSRKAASIG